MRGVGDVFRRSDKCRVIGYNRHANRTSFRSSPMDCVTAAQAGGPYRVNMVVAVWR